MANFEKVTYTYYSETLGRAVIPSEADFNALKLENIQLMKSWLEYVEEKEENGIDSAVCMMIETDYVDNQIMNGKADSSVASEAIGGHSISFNSTARTKLEELNTKSTAEKKVEKAKLFVNFYRGLV